MLRIKDFKDAGRINASLASLEAVPPERRDGQERRVDVAAMYEGGREGGGGAWKQDSDKEGEEEGGPCLEAIRHGSRSRCKVTQKSFSSNHGVFRQNCEACLQGAETSFVAKHPCDLQDSKAFLLMKKVAYLIFFRGQIMDVFLTDVTSSDFLSVSLPPTASSSWSFSIPINANMTVVQEIVSRFPSQCSISSTSLYPSLKDIVLLKNVASLRCWYEPTLAYCATSEYRSSYCDVKLFEMWYGTGRVVSISQGFESCATKVLMGSSYQDYCWAYLFYDCTNWPPYITVRSDRSCRDICNSSNLDGIDSVRLGNKKLSHGTPARALDHVSIFLLAICAAFPIYAPTESSSDASFPRNYTSGMSASYPAF
eukprot:765551-Hanusia_phi.AAC.2